MRKWRLLQIGIMSAHFWTLFYKIGDKWDWLPFWLKLVISCVFAIPLICGFIMLSPIVAYFALDGTFHRERYDQWGSRY